MNSGTSGVLGIINTVKVLDGHFQINRHQCKRLVGFYTRVEHFFDHLQRCYIDDADLHETSLPSLNVLTSVLQKGHLLVLNCTKVDWCEHMDTSGVNRESFISIHRELEACIRSIHEVVKHAIACTKRSDAVPFVALESAAPLLSLDENDRAMLFKGDAERDKKHLLKKMELKQTEATLSASARNTKLVVAGRQKSPQIRPFCMASEQTSALEMPAAPADLLPSHLRIEASEIEVLDRIGSGGSAVVCKCRWLHRDFAVKIFRAHDVVGLRKEVQNLIPLRHPNVVLLVGFSIHESDSSLMVVVELLDCDLNTLIRTNDIKMGTAIDFLYQIAAGMAYVHKKKLFHGDLKTMNVLVKCHPNGWNNVYELKISDFGVSEKLLVSKEMHDTGYDSDYDSTSFSKANVGTTRWRAPEVFDAAHDGVGMKPYSMKADVYSFAMTCVEILTRQVPYPSIATRDVGAHVRAGGRPMLPRAVPEDLRKLLVRCWNGDPSCRPDFLEICTRLQEIKDVL